VFAISTSAPRIGNLPQYGNVWTDVEESMQWSWVSEVQACAMGGGQAKFLSHYKLVFRLLYHTTWSQPNRGVTLWSKVINQLYFWPNTTSLATHCWAWWNSPVPFSSDQFIRNAIQNIFLLVSIPDPISISIRAHSNIPHITCYFSFHRTYVLRWVWTLNLLNHSYSA